MQNQLVNIAFEGLSRGDDRAVEAVEEGAGAVEAEEEDGATVEDVIQPDE